MTAPQPLATVAATNTWLHPELLAVATDIADRRHITGTQTRKSIEDEFVPFENTLTVDGGVTVSTSYVLDPSDDSADRVATVAEVLAELAHAAGMGDLACERTLTHLLGADDAGLLKTAGATYL